MWLEWSKIRFSQSETVTRRFYSSVYPPLGKHTDQETIGNIPQFYVKRSLTWFRNASVPYMVY